MSEDSYPVIVTYTYRHIIWVEARNQQEAVEGASVDTYELTSDSETLLEADWKVEAPTWEWDWDDIYEGGYLSAYPGRDFAAHVETRKAWLRKVARDHELAMWEHEDREEVPDAERQTCGLCRQWREPGHEDSFRHQMELRSQMAVSR